MSTLKVLTQGSYYGQICYKLSGYKIFKYKEDKSLEDIDEKFYPIRPSSSRETTIVKVDGVVNDDVVLVSFESIDDLENPQNWPVSAKLFIGVYLSLMSGFAYISSSIYLPSKLEMMGYFDISDTVATLPLSLFVIGYGIGPLLFSPLSEHPRIGRNLIYLPTLILFLIIQIPICVISNFTGICVMRFISGFLISPVLSTTGATFADMFTLPYLPLIMATWGIGCCFGLGLGPLIGSALITSTHDWRWSFWALLIISGGFSLGFFIFIPETYAPTILRRKAKRLQRITKNRNIVSESSGLNFSRSTVYEILWRPVEIGVKEPVVLMINLYIGLLYAVTYLWFEGVPILFTESKGFSVLSTGLIYISLLIGSVIGAAVYDLMIYSVYTKPMLANKQIYPEVFIPAAIVGGVLLPTGIFITGWTGVKDLHWVGSAIGIMIFGASSILLFQTLLNYIAMSFSKYVASAFASNAFARSILAGCFPLFGRSLFINLSTSRFPIALGSTVIGGISVLMIGIPVYFYFNGPKLRARSVYSSL